MSKIGWEKYSVVNVQYTNQVVASRKDAEDKKADSLKTVQLVEMMAMAAEQQANDSLQIFSRDNEHNTTDVNLIQQSIQRDDNGENPDASETTTSLGNPLKVPPVLINPEALKKAAAATVTKPAVKPAAKTSKPVKPVVKPVIKSAVTTPKPATAKPAVLMPKPAGTVTKPVTKPVKKPVAKPPVKKPENDY